MSAPDADERRARAEKMRVATDMLAVKAFTAALRARDLAAVRSVATSVDVEAWCAIVRDAQDALQGFERAVGPAEVAAVENPGATSSLWDRITPEELAAEDLILIPMQLVTDEQIAATVAWLRAEGDRKIAEAGELEAERRRRRTLHVVPGGAG